MRLAPQDANGGIWKLDLSFSFTSQAPERLVSFHAGAIHGCDTSPVTNLVATTGVDSEFRRSGVDLVILLCKSLCRGFASIQSRFVATR